MAGRPRKPTPLHALDGTTASPGARNPDAPEPEPIDLEPLVPARLNDQEKLWWIHFSKLAASYHLTTAMDAEALEMLAVTMAHAQLLRDFFRALQKDDPANVFAYDTTKENGDFMRRKRPEVEVLQATEQRLLVLLGRFGLTPSDRTKVKDLNKKTDGTDPDREFS